MHRRLASMGLDTQQPHGAFYVFPDITSLLGLEVRGRVLRTSHDVVQAFLEDAHVAGVAGACFGDDRHVRFSFVRPLPELEAACDALEAFVLRYRKPARPAMAF